MVVMSRPMPVSEAVVDIRLVPQEMPRVLIIAENASLQLGGEAAIPLHYFRVLRKRNVQAWMIVHERTRAELLERFPQDRDRLVFVSDTPMHRMLWRASARLPEAVSTVACGFPMHLLTQLAARREAIRLIAEHRIDVVHQPIPVSPKQPSLLTLNVPTVIGPMNGGMTYPRAFRHLGSTKMDWLTPALRLASLGVHLGVRGKLEADVLLVANQRTREALPRGIRGKVVELVENGVELDTWSPPPARVTTGPFRVAFMGRLVDWKALDVLIDAVSRFSEVAIDVIGDGPVRPVWEAQAQRVGLADRVRFHGWVEQARAREILARVNAFALPSVRECGGAVVLEAMACGLPVIATAWGGPVDYLDSTCGFLIAPTSREALVSGFADAIDRLRRDPELCTLLGSRGRRRVVQLFDWEKKVDRMLSIYRTAIALHYGEGADECARAAQGFSAR